MDIRINGEIRRIRATVTSLSFQKEHYNVTFVKVDIVFTTVEPFFYSYNPQSWLFEGQTVNFAGEVDNAGSADTDPIFYVIFGAGTATTEVSITAFSRTLTITAGFVSGDILIIDCDNKSITKNGNEIDYSGLFPIFSPGSCPFTVGFTGVTLADVTLILAKNYL